MSEPSIETLTRDQIRKETERFSALVRQLTSRAAAAFESGGGPSVQISERDQTIHDRARAMLNGHGDALLPARPEGGNSEREILMEREAALLVLAILQCQDLEAETVEAVRQAERLAPKEAILVRECALALAHWLGATQSLLKFYDAAGQNASAAMPFAGAPLRNCRVEVNWPDLWGLNHDIGDVFDRLVELGAVSEGDLRKAGLAR